MRCFSLCFCKVFFKVDQCHNGRFYSTLTSEIQEFSLPSHHGCCSENFFFHFKWLQVWKIEYCSQRLQISGPLSRKLCIPLCTSNALSRALFLQIFRVKNEFLTNNQSTAICSSTSLLETQVHLITLSLHNMTQRLENHACCSSLQTSASSPYMISPLVRKTCCLRVLQLQVLNSGREWFLLILNRSNCRFGTRFVQQTIQCQ